MSLNVTKGIAVVAFILVSQLREIPLLKPIIDMSFLFILYFIVLVSVTEKFSFYFLKPKVNI